MNDVVEILLLSGSGTEALRRLLEIKRQNDSKWTYTWIGRQLGIKSRGHISDIMTGKRTFTKKHSEQCLKLLKIKGTKLKYLTLMLQMEESIASGEDVSIELHDRLEYLRRSLRGSMQDLSPAMTSSLMILQVHGAFGLFRYKATRQQLINFIGREHLIEVDRSLQMMLAEGLIAKEDDTYILKPEVQHLMHLEVEARNQEIIALLVECMESTKSAIKSQFHQPHLACFRMAHITVNKEKYISLLSQFKDEFFRMQGQLYSEESDMLIRMCLQIYPIGEL